MDEFLDFEEILFLFEKLLLRYQKHEYENIKKMQADTEEVKKQLDQNKELAEKNQQDLLNQEERLRHTEKWIEEMENAE